MGKRRGKERGKGEMVLRSRNIRFQKSPIFYSSDDEGSTRGSNREYNRGYSKGYNGGSKRGSYEGSNKRSNTGSNGVVLRVLKRS